MAFLLMLGGDLMYPNISIIRLIIKLEQDLAYII